MYISIFDSNPSLRTTSKNAPLNKNCKKINTNIEPVHSSKDAGFGDDNSHWFLIISKLIISSYMFDANHERIQTDLNIDLKIVILLCLVCFYIKDISKILQYCRFKD